jgi:hypothetical protein
MSLWWYRIDLYQMMLHETDPVKQRVLMRAYEKHVLEALGSRGCATAVSMSPSKAIARA